MLTCRFAMGICVRVAPNRRLPRLAMLVVFVLLWATPAAAVWAQAEAPPSTPPTPTRFEHLGQEDGLSQNSVLDILQDRQGLLWFGTQDGLNRYDGYTFAVYKHAPDDPNSLSHNSITALLEDRDGILWVGTWDGGLNRFDTRTGQITRYRHDPADLASLPHDLVAALHEDRAGRLWVGTIGGGLAQLDRATGRFTAFQYDGANPAGIGSAAVGAIYEDEAGMLWLGTGGFGVPGDGLDRFDPATGAFTHFRHDAEDPTSLAGDTISSILPDGEGRLWLGYGGYGMAGAGLDRFDPVTGAAEHFAHEKDVPASLSHDSVMELFRDASGRTWVGTWGGGLDEVVQEGEQVSFTHHRHDPFDDQSVAADIVWSLLEDRAGLLWVGTVNGGLSKINPQMQRFGLFRNHPDDESSLGFDVIGGFYEDRAGGIWIGTWGGGLDHFDRATGKFTHYRHDPDDPASLAENTVSTIYEDEDGFIWVGTFQGLDRLNRATGTFTHFRHDENERSTLIHDSVYAIQPAGDGRMWLATMGGLDLFDPATKRFTHFKHEPDDPSSIPDDTLTELYVAPSGRVWFGTWHGGAAALDPAAWANGDVRFIRYQHDPENPNSLSDNGVWAIHEDRSGKIWLGTQSGLNRLDPATGAFTHYREKDGLPNSSVFCIQEDAMGNLWMASNHGLTRMNPILARFRNFDVSHGLQSNEFNSGACLRSRNGELFFGGVDGFNVFRPEQVQDNTTPPPVVLTGFRIFNKPVNVDLAGTTPIQLSFDENFIAFEFAALDYFAPHKNRYAYRLEGFDEEWVDAEDRRYANYTNLPAGEYTFRVRGSNNDGIWNEAGVALPLLVAPPVWNTWWFRSLGLLVLFATVGAGYWWRINQVHAQNRRLEAQVAQQTAALRREIEQRRQAEAALAQKAADEAVVAERTRLARDLHDAVTQTLFSASLIADVLPELWEQDPADGRQSTEELRQLTRGALAEMRTLLLELRPSAVTQARLEELVRQLIEATTGRARLPVQYSAEGQRPLPDDVKVAIYRIAQEALNNVVKYARAQQVTVDLRQPPMGVRLTVADDGIGFDPEAVGPGHLGQKIMRERAENIGARLAVQSEIGRGTLVTVTWMDPMWREPTNGDPTIENEDV